MKFDKPTARQFRQDFADAVKELEKKYNSRIEIGTITMRGTAMSGKLTVTSLSQDGMTSEVSDTFAINAFIYGLNREWAGQTFTSKDRTFKIVGLSTRRSKNPVDIEDVNSGEKYTMSVDFLKFTMRGR